MSRKYVLLSIMPKYANQIKAGIKRIELRKRIPALSQGDIVILYESSPIQRITAYCVIDSVVALSPAEMWSTYSCVLGISKKDYDSYFLSASCAYGLCIKNVVEFSHPIKLHDSLGILRPPQSYRYLAETDFTTLCKIGI
ncbi:MAG: ASCH domain-containing protein [Clostridia bacterium]|nr:ASCH domain-containing protein [Clostridia bacterium]